MKNKYLSFYHSQTSITTKKKISDLSLLIDCNDCCFFSTTHLPFSRSPDPNAISGHQNKESFFKENCRRRDNGVCV